MGYHILNVLQIGRAIFIHGGWVGTLTKQKSESNTLAGEVEKAYRQQYKSRPERFAEEDRVFLPVSEELLVEICLRHNLRYEEVEITDRSHKFTAG